MELKGVVSDFSNLLRYECCFGRVKQHAWLVEKKVKIVCFFFYFVNFPGNSYGLQKMLLDYLRNPLNVCETAHLSLSLTGKDEK